MSSVGKRKDKVASDDDNLDRSPSRTLGHGHHVFLLLLPYVDAHVSLAGMWWLLRSWRPEGALVIVKSRRGVVAVPSRLLAWTPQSWPDAQHSEHH